MAQWLWEETRVKKGVSSNPKLGSRRTFYSHKVVAKIALLAHINRK